MVDVAVVLVMILLPSPLDQRNVLVEPVHERRRE
jgi:hypothetical protein